jgi:hypothetical protein
LFCFYNCFIQSIPNGNSTQNSSQKQNFLSPQKPTIRRGSLPPHSESDSDEDLVPCDRCIMTGRSIPLLVENDVCMCKNCWEEGTEDMRHVIRHRNNRHTICPLHYPDSELRYLPTHTIEHWKAEWHHAHNDHSLCKSSYMFGCTEIEKLQLIMLQKHNLGQHMNCESEFPIYLLKTEFTHSSDPYEVIKTINK